MTPMAVRVQRAALREKLVLRHLLELYQYDLSDAGDADVDASGHYGYPYLDIYWTDAMRHPFLVWVNGKLAGFVLVSGHTCLAGDANAKAISEFFVMRKYRGRGVGEQAAKCVFDLFPGTWEVRELAENPGAREFWRKVIDRYTGGRFDEYVLDDECWRGSVQVFETTPRGER
jgi:predicted acetyltransferase